MKNTPILLKINSIAGMFYKNDLPTDTLVIYGLGAPVVPDSGLLSDAPYILKFAVDLYVPDYIGYGRSDGEFSPQNCIHTFTELYDEFTTGTTGYNTYMGSSMLLHYKRVIIIGKSFAGTYIPVLPRFNPMIRELGIFCPAVNTKLCGSIPGEESNELFLQSMKQDGYHHLYRGILNPLWKSHLENEDDLSPMDNIHYLEKCSLFIGHGKQDTCIHFSKSQEYFKKIKAHFPKSNSFRLKLYSQGTHGASTTNKAVIDCLKWFNLTYAQKQLH